MTGEILVAVSEQTLATVGPRPTQWIHLVTVDEAREARALWRRQADRTSWAVESAARLPVLDWFHTDTVGVDRLPLRDLAERGVVLTNGRGTFTPAVSEWALGAMLMAAKRLHQCVRDSDRGHWSPVSGLQLAGKSVVILGAGDIGRAIGLACLALGMRVVAVSRSGHGRILEPHLSVGEDWRSELPSADFLVNCLPLTEATRGFVSADIIGAMKPSSWLINVGRGETVDEMALLQAVDRGELSGAILDTVIEEPLPMSSELWRCPNIVIGSHSSSLTDQSESRSLQLFITEASRYLRGEELANVVDLQAGY